MKTSLQTLFSPNDLFEAKSSLKLQKSSLLILDVLTARDTALREFDIIKDGPIGGGKEEKYGMSNDDESEVRNARKSHSFVDGRKRLNAAVRNEIVLSSINFLSERLQIEEDGTVENITRILNARSLKKIINASRELV